MNKKLPGRVFTTVIIPPIRGTGDLQCLDCYPQSMRKVTFCLMFIGAMVLATLDSTTSATSTDAKLSMAAKDYCQTFTKRDHSNYKILTNMWASADLKVRYVDIQSPKSYQYIVVNPKQTALESNTYYTTVVRSIEQWTERVYEVQMERQSQAWASRNKSISSLSWRYSEALNALFYIWVTDGHDLRFGGTSILKKNGKGYMECTLAMTLNPL